MRTAGQDDQMDRNVWTPLDLDAETAWLREGSDEGYSCGFDVSGWEATIWILHSMYESPALQSNLSHDDVHRSGVDAGLIEPSVIGDCNLNERTVLTGGGLGYSEHPGPGWSRLRWAELADRLDLAFDGQEYAPCFRWFPYSSWPVSICPPSEGSLDSETLDRLISHLAVSSSSANCIAAHSFLSGGCDDQRQRCFSGPVARLRDFVEGDEWAAIPSNFWAPDRSWMVYTDWDLWATKVSGSLELVRSLQADSDLETLSWKRA
jgi:hypothetical protein